MGDAKWRNYNEQEARSFRFYFSGYPHRRVDGRLRFDGWSGPRRARVDRRRRVARKQSPAFSGVYAGSEVHVRAGVPRG